MTRTEVYARWSASLFRTSGIFPQAISTNCSARHPLSRGEFRRERCSARMNDGRSVCVTGRGIWSNAGGGKAMFVRLGSLVVFAAMAAAAQEHVSDAFEKEIRPVLAERCYLCHSASAAVPQGGL